MGQRVGTNPFQAFERTQAAKTFAPRASSKGAGFGSGFAEALDRSTEESSFRADGREGLFLQGAPAVRNEAPVKAPQEANQETEGFGPKASTSSVSGSGNSGSAHAGSAASNSGASNSMGGAKNPPPADPSFQVPRASAQSADPSENSTAPTSTVDPRLLAAVQGFWPQSGEASAQAVTETSSSAVDPSLFAPSAMTQEQRAIVKFLRSMEIEMGVKPQNILEAFSKMDGASLEAPPEETQGDFLKQLKLNPSQEIRARALYENLLSETASLRQTQESRDLNLAVLSPDQARQKEILGSIEKLNREFFVPRDRNPIVLPPPDRQRLDELRNQMQQAQGMAQYDLRTDDEMNGPNVELVALAPFETQNLPEAPVEAGPSEFSPLSKPEAMNVLTSAVRETSAPRKENGSDQGSSKEAPMPEGMGLTTGAVLAKPTEFFTMAPDMGAQAALPEAKQANVEQLVSGSQLLIRDGGGQMKVQLTPEGLGTVDLKVDVRDGKVDIQMVTESKEAKKLIEEGLDGLKSGLAGHRLSLENVKVDVDMRSGNEFRQGQFDQGRDAAREFLQQFRNGNQARRDGFFESLAAAGGPQRSGKKTTAPLATAQRSRESRRLDLVA